MHEVVELRPRHSDLFAVACEPKGGERDWETFPWCEKDWELSLGWCFVFLSAWTDHI